MFDIALGIFLFLSPIIFLFGNNAKINGTIGALGFYQFKTLSFSNNILQLQFFEYGIVVLFIIALMKRPLRDFKDKYLACFLGLCALSVLFHPKTSLVFVPIFLGFLLYYLVVQYAKHIKKLLYVIAFVSILNTVFTVLQFFNIYWLYNPPENNTICGMMFSPTSLGIYQALAFPVCYMINPFLSIIPLISVLLSKSYTPLIAISAGMVYLWFPKRRKIFINLAPMGIIALTGVFIVIFARNYNSFVYKLGLKSGLWISTLKEILSRPFVGSGLGTFSELSSKFYSKMGHWEWTYNEYLGVAFCVGIASLFLIGLFLIDKFQNTGTGLERIVATSCLIIAVICLGQSPLHFPRLVGTIIPLFAFLEILKRRKECV